MELLRKLIYGLKKYYPHADFSCEDVRNIVIDIENKNNGNITLTKDDIPLQMDINSMYDVIWGNGVHKHINLSVHELLPINYISNELLSLLHRCLDHVYNYAYFIYEYEDFNGTIHDIIKQIIHSQIQGSKSGDPSCDLYLFVFEILHYTDIKRFFKYFIRYKDDKIAILNDGYKYTNQNVSNILSTIYKDKNIKWDIEFDTINKTADCCDLTIGIDHINNKITYKATNQKVKSYICKSSNVKQSINGICKTLQERYIIINDNKDDYIHTKQLMFNALIEKNEWSPYDLRNISHLDFSMKNQLLDKYINKNKIKHDKYINNNHIHLYSKKWWCKSLTTPLNVYLTYQKTIINEKELNNIVNKANKIIPFDIRNEFDMNIYYKYQKPISKYIK